MVTVQCAEDGDSQPPLHGAATLKTANSMFAVKIKNLISLLLLATYHFGYEGLGEIL
jgi:hypothetical protein